MTALAIVSSPQSMLHRAGAFTVLAAALASLGYSIAAGELSFLAIYIVCVVVGSAIALRTAGAEFGQANALSLFLVVFSVNVLMILAFAHVLTNITGGPFLDAPEGVIPDDERFYGYGTSIAHAWLRAEKPEFPLGVKFFGYPYILAACNYFSAYFGDMSSVSPRLLNATVGALLPLTVYRIAILTYEDRQVARTAALLTALFPVFAFYSSLLLRDMIVAYLIAVAILVFLKSATTSEKADRAVYLAVLGFVLAGLFFVRDLSAFVPLAGFAIYIFARQPGWAKLVSIVIVVALVLQVMTVLDMDAPKIRMSLPSTERAMTTETLNVSSGGVYCTIRNYVEPATKVALTILLPSFGRKGKKTQVVSCNGVVVRCQGHRAGESQENGDFDLACAFTDIKKEDRLLIEEYIGWRLMQDLVDERLSQP